MEWANPAEKRACENSSTVPNRQLTGSSRRSPHPESQLQGLQFPYWGSSRLEDGLSNLSWEIRGYELCPLGSHTHSFHNSERGWKIMPAASERRSRPERGFAIEGPHPCALSLELPGVERSGEGVQTKPQPRLYHSIQPQRSWIPASTGWLLLYCHEGKNPILTRFAPKAHFRNFLWWGRSMHLLDRSWPPVLGSGVRHVLEESFLNFSRVTERFS